jgi:hypothetical protein
VNASNSTDSDIEPVDDQLAMQLGDHDAKAHFKGQAAVESTDETCVSRGSRRLTSDT